MLGISFNQHKSIVALFKARYVDVGDTCRDSQTVNRMTGVISTSLHDELIQMIVNGHSPISIIADGTTTKISNHYFLSVLFQFYHENQVVVKFYRLIHLPGSMDGSAENQVKALITKLEADGILEHMKKRTIGDYFTPQSKQHQK